MSVDMLMKTWKEFRKGLIAEVEQIPEDKFRFRATPETRNDSRAAAAHRGNTEDTRRRSGSSRRESEPAAICGSCQ